MPSTAPNADNLYLHDQIGPISVANMFQTSGYYHWGASIYKGDEGLYHLFYSRWKKEYTFTGWLTHSEIAHAVSDSSTGPWEYCEIVLTGRGQPHWDAITAHNPKIKHFEGKYYLYYCSTNIGNKKITEAELAETAKTGYEHPNWKILRPNQRSGVAISASVNGPWERMDRPLLDPSLPIATLAVNPAVERSRNGKYYLIVKGDKPGATGFVRSQAVASAPSPVGPFQMHKKAVIDDIDTEDMSLFYANKRFYGVFHAHDFIGMITSEDGLNWKKANDPVLMTKRIKMQDGSILELERLERPSIYTENGKPHTLSLAAKQGNESYSLHIPLVEPPYPRPNERQLAWQQAEMGVLFSYDLHVFERSRYEQANDRINPIAGHQIFAPAQLDTDQWIRAAKSAGATFAVLTASHETGFALFQSEANPYCMRALNWRGGKGDIVKDFVESCCKYSVKPGIYLGIRWNALFGVHDFKVVGESFSDFQENRRRWYNKMVEGMVREICTNYGELFEIWFDGGADHPGNGAPDVLPIVRRYQPGCLFYHNGQLAEARWGGSESGTVGYPCWATFPYPSTGAGESAPKDIPENDFQLLKQGDPNGAYWMPAMADAPASRG